MDTQAFSRAQLYILSPALVYIATARAEVANSLILRVFLFISVIVLFLFIVSQIVAFAVRGTKPLRHAISLTSMFMNSGFYGIPVCMLAFGEKGFIYAATYVVASSILQSSVGIFLAASGTNRSVDAVKSVLKVPVLYAIIVARLSANYNVYPPESFTKILDLLGHSAIPIGLLLLGMQLERIIVSLKGEFGGAAEIGEGAADEGAATEGGAVSSDAGIAQGVTTGGGAGSSDAGIAQGAATGGGAGSSNEGIDNLEVTRVEKDAAAESGITYSNAGSSLDATFVGGEGKEALIFGSIAAALRIGGGLAAALVVLLFMDFDPVLKKVLIVEASMPTAVNTVVYTTEFRCKPQLAAVTVLVSTIASIVTIPLILKFVV